MEMGGSCINFLLIGTAGLALATPFAQAQSPYESSADFAK